MNVTSLCYHDVIQNAAFDSSGFAGADSASYKLDRPDFKRHLEALARAGIAVVHNPDRLAGDDRTRPCLLTFDDGGAGAYHDIAPLLESYGWRGFFFITTNYINVPRFLTSAQIRELHQRGHVIGSHSCSHRGRMSSFSWERLVAEWAGSVNILSDLLGEQVTTASVPSGFYSSRVAETAAFAGLTTLFTLEPTTQVQQIAGCRVLGRYLMKRTTPPEAAAGLATGSLSPCLRQWMSWKVKKAAKSGLGDLYPLVRRAYYAWQRSAQ